MKYLAHSANKARIEQSMEAHTKAVSQEAAKSAKEFDVEEEARLAGLLHDIGKYSDRFMKRLEGKEKGLDHWSIGAWIALKYQASIAAALAIQGHHIGLQQGDKAALYNLDPNKLSVNHPLSLNLTETDCDLLLERLNADGFTPVTPARRVISPKADTASAMISVRMLFSALVDADFLDTEEHFKEKRHAGLPLEAERALAILEDYVIELAKNSEASEIVQKMRNDLWQACGDARNDAQEIYTLTAPTGTGKTLAMLRFALRHAVKNGLRRIVIVVPYLSIIEQTAREYRKIFRPHFGDEYLLEHHSMADWRREPDTDSSGNHDAEEEERQRKRLSSENWDAPIIITTNVQLLESLFSNRPSACRKLHRLAGSVILFDEAQTLPTALAIPTLKTLSGLTAERYRTTVVFSTATQPAFSSLSEKVQEEGNSGWQPKEIVPPNIDLFARAKRVDIDWSQAKSPVAWTNTAGQIEKLDRVLCIVNLKRHAQQLTELLNDVPDVWHLSTLMCPAHRVRVLKTISERLKDKKDCRLISTQCIEAGVDLDSPFVYRAFGPLEAIAQAAGRCNRNGNNTGNTNGKVIVFSPDEPEDKAYPSRLYAQCAGATRTLLNDLGEQGMDINRPDLFEKYYRLLYSLADPEVMREDIKDAILRQDYAEVAKLYRVIDEDTINVLVPYAPDGNLDEYNRLAHEARQNGLSAKWMRQAQPYIVSLYRPKYPSNYLEPITTFKGDISEYWYIYRQPVGDPPHYDPQMGLLIPPNSGALFG